ncbi:MAG: WD40-repeat-containing domain protein [Linnemannia elongata]|nr:MAG: WD40-repeat-containing domain protein [Linnemannia elongata]
MSASNAPGHQSSQQVDPAIEKLVREQKSLKAKIDVLEAENKALKKSLFELSYIYSAQLGSSNHQANSNNNNNSVSRPLNNNNNRGINGDLSVSSTTTSLPHTANNAQDGSSKSDGRQFFLKNDLKGHQGAVYAVQYSPNGKYLATGSFDKTVRIWDGTTNQNELYVLKGHGLNISDLAWGHDSTLLLSGAYDKTCKLWDVESGKQLDSFEGEGFVQCVRFHPQDNHIFFSGTTRNMLTMIDTRKDSNPTSGSAIAIKNDAMVNSIYVYHDGLTVISGDSSGYLKTWDMRMGKVLQAILNEPTKKPISHLAVSKQRGSLDGVSLAETEEPESRWLAVNSYDNVIRVYDRGFEPPTTMPRLVYSLKGYRNKHWPIKSAFFHGKDCKTGKVRGGDGDEAPSTVSDKDIPLESSLILASGSMDPYVYLFDVGAGDGQYEVLQKLSGHTDRVYDVDFHPVDHVLASGSADFSVKVWGRASKRKK